MQLARDLKAAGLGAFPCRLTFDNKKNKWQKQPLTVDREPWAVTAHRHPNDPAVAWQDCRVIGIPIPSNVVVIDLDTYRPGCTPENAAQLLGCDIPWARALIQTTIGGGQHYAFRLPDWDVKQGSNLGGPGSGIDTRVAGKGFICSGEGYTPADTFGVLRMVYPESLPQLPDGARLVLENTAPELTQVTEASPLQAPSDDTILAALRHIDPTERDTWRDIGFAIKHQYQDDQETGFEIWDRWSCGEFWSEAITSYTAETQRSQWDSFKVEKQGATITAGTLYHMAMRAGWQPPARFDAAEAFGVGAASLQTFNGLVERIMEQGASSKNVEGIMQAIAASGCNQLQAVLLRNELKASLKQARLLDKDLAAVIDKQITPKPVTFDNGLYTKNHTENAELFLQSHYPDGTLIRLQEIWYAYTGKVWAEQPDAYIDHLLTMAMNPARPQKPTINGTYQMISSMAHVIGAEMNNSPEHLIAFQNGVLDLTTGNLLPHDKQYLTTKIMPYNYNPSAEAPNWLFFLHEVLEGDPERIALMQEWLGYMIAGTYQFQKIMLFIGPTRSGKGTIGTIMSELVGADNYTGASLASFGEDSFLDGLRNKTVAVSGDTAKNINRYKVDTVIERLKKISGNDYVDFTRKFKSHMSARLPTRITLMANHIPRLFDDSEALSNRLLVLPFDVSFAGREDPYLINTLLHEIEGIALWALHGLTRLHAQNGFTIPMASRAEMQFIAESYSPLRGFLDDVCVFGDPEPAVSSFELYEAYKAWALAQQEDRLLSRKMFISAFKDISRGKGCKYGTHRLNIGTCKGFKGVRITEVQTVAKAAFTPAIVK